MSEAELDKEFTKAMVKVGEFRRVYKKSDPEDVSNFFTPVTSQMTAKEFEEYIGRKLLLEKGPDIADGVTGKQIFVKGAGITGWNLLYYNWAFSFEDEVAFAFRYSDNTYSKITERRISLGYTGF